MLHRIVEPRKITLEWKGPYSLHPNYEPSISAEDIPSSPAVYMWTIATNEGHRIAYVGESGNLLSRQYQHIRDTLGGGYELYDDEYFNGSLPNKEADPYKPSPQDLNLEFVRNFESLSSRALRNLTSYRWFWAVPKESGEDVETKVRKLVESAIITEARERDPHLRKNNELGHGEGTIQNTRVSLRPRPECPIEVHSEFASETDRPKDSKLEVPYVVS